MYDGIVILNKSAGMTSQSAVSRLRRLFGGVKAGHTGTLDPMATGVLPVLLGTATKASEFLLEGGKQYRATLRLGMTTDTEDSTGTVLTRSATLPPPDALPTLLPRFRGQILQTPPMYSALHVGGRRLMDLARAGEVVERTPRPITVYRLEATPLPGEGEGVWALEVACSKGTYIRTLCADIGAALGCGAVMTALTRTAAAGFPLSAAHTLEEIAEMDEAARAALLLPTESLFASLPAAAPPAFFVRLAQNGCELYQKKIGTDYPVGTRVRLYDGERFFALGEVREYPDGTAVKPIRFF